MRNTRRRLDKLEQSPQFQPPPSPFQQIKNRALGQISNEDLALMRILVMDVEAGVVRAMSEEESAIWARLSAVCETEALRMGFKSFAQAERIWGHRR